eukprot:4485592-Amphidinium_carterae.1
MQSQLAARGGENHKKWMEMFEKYKVSSYCFVFPRVHPATNTWCRHCPSQIDCIQLMQRAPADVYYST